MLRVLARVALIPTLLLFSLITLSVLATSVARGAINNQISFQGKLTNTDGTNVTNGTYSIAFSLYTASSGGTAVWTETQSSVTLTDGIFQVNLGSVTSLPGSVDFNSGSIYLGVKVGADPEMTPRILFTASPYAFNSDKLGGIAASGFVQLSPSAQQTGFINISGNATVGGTYNGNTFTSSALTFGAAGTATIQSAATQALNVTGNAASTVSTSSGNLTLQAGSGTVSLGSSTILSANGALSINSGTATALTIDSGTTGALNIGTGSNAKTITIGNNTGATAIATMVGTGTSVFKIQGPSSAVYMQVDSTNDRLYVGNPSGTTDGFLLVLESKTSAGDPAGVNGGQYYNASNNKFRCYQNGAWRNCLTTNAVGLVAVLTANDAAIANTEAQAIGYTIPANTSVAGDTYRIRAYATRTGTNTATPTIRVRVGSTSLSGNIAATLTGIGNGTAATRVYEALITVRTIGATGTVGGGLTEYANAAGNLTSSTTPVTMDTTANKIIELTMTSGNTANSYTFTYATIEKLNNIQ